MLGIEMIGQLIALATLADGSDRQAEIFRYLFHVHHYIGVSFHSLNHIVHDFDIMFLFHNSVILM